MINTKSDPNKPDLDDKKYRVADNILFRRVENEGILLHIPSGTYYSLSETSIEFWHALTSSQPLAPVIERITDEYEVEREQVVADLQNLLQDLSNCGVITPLTV